MGSIRMSDKNFDAHPKCILQFSTPCISTSSCKNQVNNNCVVFIGRSKGARIAFFLWLYPWSPLHSTPLHSTEYIVYLCVHRGFALECLFIIERSPSHPYLGRVGSGLFCTGCKCVTYSSLGQVSINQCPDVHDWPPQARFPCGQLTVCVIGTATSHSYGVCQRLPPHALSTLDNAG